MTSCAKCFSRTHCGCARRRSSATPRRALATLDEHRLLCAHRRGPYGVRYWNRQVERWLTDATGEPIWTDWYAGRPVLVTANDYGLGLYNGDTGVTVVRERRRCARSIGRARGRWSSRPAGSPTSTPCTR